MASPAVRCLAVALACLVATGCAGNVSSERDSGNFHPVPDLGLDLAWSDSGSGDGGSDLGVDGQADLSVDASAPEVIRLAGADRVATAAAVSAAGWQSSVSAIVVSGASSSFPDGLAAGALAGKRSAPILLTNALGGCAAGDALLSEIARLGAASVEVIGGSAAVSDACLALLGSNASRISGANRYETAAAVATRVGLPASNKAVVVSGLDFPDGVVAGPSAGVAGMPILLTTASALPGPTSTALGQLGVTSTLLVGGVAAATDSGLPAPLRVSGANRCETSTAMATYGATNFGLSYQNLIVVNGSSSVDGIVAVGLGVKLGAPILLTNNSASTLCTAARDLIIANKTQVARIYLVGGPAAIDATLEAELASLLQ